MENGAEKAVAVVGGGVAGMSAACALAEAGLRVKLVERRGYLGGRASSYRHPGVDEVIDNCQHVLFGCCTNLIGFYRRIGVEKQIHWTRDDDHDRAGRAALACSGLDRGGCRRRCTALPRLLTAQRIHARRTNWRWRGHFARCSGRSAANSTESLGAWLRRQRADRRRHGSLLAAGDCQRAECATWTRSRCPTRRK